MPQDPLSLLCVEPRFPGRLGAVADWLVRKRGYRCFFFCSAADAREHWPAATGDRLELVQFPVSGVAREPAVAWRRGLERGLCYAYGCWEALEARRLRPLDVALGCSAGLGSTLFLPVFLPRVPIVNLFDYYLLSHSHDLADEAGPDTPPAYFRWRRSANAMDLLDLENGVVPWTATAWQRDLYPPEYRKDFIVLHAGTDSIAPPTRPQGRRVIGGRSVPHGAKVVSFVARCLDRVRGFDRFVRLAATLQRDDRDVLCVAAGGPVSARAIDPAFFGQDYLAHALAQTPLPDRERFWVLGSVAPAVVGELVRASDLHVYPSRTYPIGQSLLEALAHGCVVLASDDAPVREVIADGVTGLLVPGKDDAAWHQQSMKVLSDLAAHRPLGEAAAHLVRSCYARDVTLPSLAELLCQLAHGRR